MLQPSLSRRHLRSLEDRAGTTLLLRDTRRMRLTEAGHRLLADAPSLLALADDASDRLRGDRVEMHPRGNRDHSSKHSRHIAAVLENCDRPEPNPGAVALTNLATLLVTLLVVVTSTLETLPARR